MNSRLVSSLACLAVARLILVASVGGAAAHQPSERYDIIVRNGTVIDGTGNPPFVADLAIAAGRIAHVGVVASRADVELDATGLYVTPGFINIHSHASPPALATAVNMLSQGVTTEILNADGSGPVDIAPQLAAVERSGLAINVGAYTGFNSAWTSVVGNVDRRAIAEDIATMRAILVRNLEAGAWGVSAGLDYKPAYFATTEEVIDVVKAAAPWRTNFTNHDRVIPETKFSSRAGIAETIAIGARAGLMPVVTHMKVTGSELGTAAASLRLLTDATRRGRYSAADAYPYLAGQTGLGALIIPAWAQDGGREKLLERFKDPATRSRIAAETEEAMTARFGGPQSIYLPDTRRQLTDVMRELGVPAGEAVIRLLEIGNLGAIITFGTEADVIKILQHSTTSVACDCGAAAEGRSTHPRYYGSYPRVLGRYVRELKVLSWPDAIRKMTLLPAATIGMIDRGAIAVGMVADVTIFDPRTVIDHATYAEPGLRSEGIRHVIVNGGLALRDGNATGECHGRTLTRKKYMPSRPAVRDASRQVSAKGDVTSSDGAATLQLDLKVAQYRRTQSASGTFRLTDQGRGRTLEARELGLLQVAKGWATLSARVRVLSSGDEHSAIVVIEQADPWLPDQSPSVTILVEGLGEFSGRLPKGRVRITGA